MLDASLIEAEDVCEFLSDTQTDKGPCTGLAIWVDQKTITIGFNDTEETFNKSALIVNYGRNKKDWTYWELA